MNLDIKKNQIQLNIVTKILEKQIGVLGLLSDFDLVQIPLSSESKQACIKTIELYEQIISKFTAGEIKRQKIDRILFSIVNFYYNSKQYSKALERIDHLIVLFPNQFKIQYSKGKIYEALEQPEKASECYELALKMKPDHVSASHHTILQEKISKNHPCKPLDSLSKQEQKILAQYNKGISLAKIKQFDNAIICFDIVLSMNSNHISSLYNKGIALEATSRLDEALKCYELVLKMKPDHVSALYNKSVLYARVGKYEEAISLLDTILEINPNHILALYNKGILLLETNQFEKSITYLDRTLEIEPNHTSAAYHKGIALEATSRLDEALKCYELVLKMKPDHVSASHHKKTIETKLESHSKGIFLLEAGHYDNAIIFFNNVLDSSPRYIHSLYHKGMALESLSQLEKALECYQIIIQCDPQYGNISLRIGRIYAALGKHSEAIMYYDIMLDSNPDNTDVLYHKAHSTLKQGKKEESRSLIKHMASLDCRYMTLFENDPDYFEYMKDFQIHSNTDKPENKEMRFIKTC
jgi:tetratricopeptide (TPR) repeat protein